MCILWHVAYFLLCGRLFYDFKSVPASSLIKKTNNVTYQKIRRDVPLPDLKIQHSAEIKTNVQAQSPERYQESCRLLGAAHRQVVAWLFQYLWLS